MKKIFSLLLALLLVFACSANCFAMFTNAENPSEKYEEETYGGFDSMEPIGDPAYSSYEESASEQLLRSLIFALIVGLIVGLVSKGSAKASMRTIAQASNASEYVVQGSFNLRWADNVLIGVHESVQPKADNNSNHGGGGSPQNHSGGGGSPQHHRGGGSPQHPGSGRSPQHQSGGPNFHGSHPGSGGHSHSGGGGRHF